MKFKFSNNLQYQLDAVNAITDIFDTGANMTRKDAGFVMLAQNAIVANELVLNEERMLMNVQMVQGRNRIEDKSISIGTHDFSVEMETGTGKTYVYLRTAMELNKRYGLKKFIILVPSVAIREGVLKTIKQTREHFADIYGFRCGAFAYDSVQLQKVRNDFARSPDMIIMIMTIQSFNKDTAILCQSDRDDTHGERYLDLIAETRPVVIMDEPQNMESELSKAAIGELNALFRLRYSATHKERHNLMYRLTPIDAYSQGLVKTIEVHGVTEDDAGAFVFDVREIIAKKGSSPTAKVKLEVKNAAGAYVIKELLVKGGEDLYSKSGKNAKYTDLIVDEISARSNSVELSNQKQYFCNTGGEDKEAAFRTQIRETIRVHMRKQEEFGEQMKVLSLFFIDSVNNYVHEESLLRKIFEEEYMKLRGRCVRFNDIDAHAVHRGYFAKKSTKKGTEFLDTRGDSKNDKDTYDLIMKDKERLLSFEEKVSFIFSHSALKEGWDNPNVFQICTLNQTASSMKKRQEIGRGLRLPINIYGDRVHDERMNVLTVIANESYKEFVGTLQQEYLDAGYTSAPRADNARVKVKVEFRKQLATDNVDFKALWEKIRKKTRYSIEVSEEVFLKKALSLINNISAHAIVMRIDRGQVVLGKDGSLVAVHHSEGAGERLQRDLQINDIASRIAIETNITRRTVFKLLSSSETFGHIFINPEDYVRNVIECVRTALHEILVGEGLRYTEVGEMWELDVFDVFSPEGIPVRESMFASKKSAYSHVVCDGVGEHDFAFNLEKNNRVSVYAKLPSKFKIETPIGNYNPDWAIVWNDDEGGQKLYLVRETKFVLSDDSLRGHEKQMIECGKRHFEAIGVDYKECRSQDLSDLIA